MTNIYPSQIIWDRAAHSAFTDLCAFNGKLWCCFREAQSHISRDGNIRILRLDQECQLELSTKIDAVGADLRDPKLTVTPDSKLMLIAYRVNDIASNASYNHHPVCWSSSDGSSWSQEKPFGDSGWWLWRVRWHSYHQKQQTSSAMAYGFAYNRGHQKIHLYRGDPRRKMHKWVDEALGWQKHGLGYPNESDMIFVGNTAYALIRRDADSCTAQLGLAKFPFKRWQWRDLGQYIGGPCMVRLTETTALVAGRYWKNSRFTTAVWTLDLLNAQLTLQFQLPSAGDNSYPGLAEIDGTIYLSYYSSHHGGKSKIYLAKFGLSELKP